MYPKLNINRVSKLTLNGFSKLTVNGFSKLTINRVSKLTINRVSKLTINGFSKLTINRVSKLTIRNILLTSFIFSRCVEILGHPPLFVRIQLSHRHWLMCRYISGDLNKDATPSSSLRHPKSSCLLSRTVKQSVRDSLLGRW